jgi:hypothetical protein
MIQLLASSNCGETMAFENVAAQLKPFLALKEIALHVHGLLLGFNVICA